MSLLGELQPHVERYDRGDVPASGTDRSRFALTSTPGGVQMHSAEVIMGALSALVAERLEGMSELAPAFKQVPLYKITATDGRYELVGIKTLAKVPTHADLIPNHAKYGTTDGLKAGALVDALLLGDFDKPLHPSQIWKAFCELAEQEKLTGYPLVQLNRTAATYICARHGIVIRSTTELPY